MTVSLRPLNDMNKIPKTLLREVVALNSTCRQKTIYLLGTCHVSAKSCADVRLLISSVQPKAVFLELCQSRREVLDDNFSRDYRSKHKDLSYSEIIQKLRSGELDLFTLAYSSILRSISNELNITPGSEFKAAYDCALALPTRAYIVLGDRDVGITVNRLWNGLTAMQKIKLMGHVIYQSFSGGSWSNLNDDLEAKIDDFKQDRSKIFDEFNRVLGDKFPWVVEALLNERDVFMMLELRKVVGRDWSALAMTACCVMSMFIAKPFLADNGLYVVLITFMKGSGGARYGGCGGGGGSSSRGWHCTAVVPAAEQVARGVRRLVKARADASSTRHLPAAAAVLLIDWCPLRCCCNGV